MRPRNKAPLLGFALLILAGSGSLLGCQSTDDLESQLQSSGNPYIRQLIPSEGSVGTTVVLRGGNFGSAAGVVTFADIDGKSVSATVGGWSLDTVTVSVPITATSTQQTSVNLTTSDGKVTPFPGTFTLTCK